MNSVPARQATLLVAFMWFAYFLNYCDRQAVFAEWYPAGKDPQVLLVEVSIGHQLG